MSFGWQIVAMLEPFFLFKEIHHNTKNQNHDTPKNKIAVFIFEFRNVFKIHSVDAGKEGERNKDGCENG